MSLYDKAKVIFSGAAGAGNKEVAYNIKPVEKLKVDELIKNNGFDTDSDWFKSTGVTISGGKANFPYTSSGYKRISQDNVFEAGKTYKVSFELDIEAGSVKVGTASDSNSMGIFKTSGKHSVYYTGVEGEDRFDIARNNEPYDFTIDNVSVREVEQKANDFSFVRASDLTATYEGADGLIRKTRENLLTYSNKFTESGSWYKSSGVTLTAGQSGYDGSSNAFKMAVSSAQARIDQNVSTSGVQTFSIYAKKGSENGIFLRANGGENPRAFFRLDTGAVGTTAGGSAFISADIDSIGSNWYRCSITVDETLDEVRVYVADNANGFPSSGDIFIQNAQLEQGLVATPYIDRTDSYSKSTAGIQEDEPRYDYSLNNALPPALLYEPERKNELKHSEHIGSSFWEAFNTVTVTSNDSTSPEGLDNATSIDGGNDYPIVRSNEVTLDTSTEYVFSFYAKNVDATEVRYRVYDEDLNGDIISPTNYISQLSTTEWKRIEVPFTTQSASTNYRFYFSSSNMNGEILVWGAQVEKGSCVTSYIPTYGSAATRETDTIPQYTPSSTNLDKYTFFAHSHSDRVTSDNRAPRLKGDGNSALMGIFVNTALKKQFFLYDNENNSKLSKATFGSFEAGDDTKYAFVVDNIALEAKLFIDGVLRETISLTERVDAKIISVGNSDGNPDRIKSIMYFPEALEDGDVVSLTT